MKRLLIMRHARAEPTSVDGDAERALSASGDQEALLMGRRLAQRALYPERLLASAARRARQTAETLARALHFPLAGIELNPDLYLADRARLLECLRGQPEDVATVMLVGHEPGLSDLCRFLTQVRLDALPTAAIFAAEAAVASWRELDAGVARLAFFDAPTLPPGALRH